MVGDLSSKPIRMGFNFRRKQNAVIWMYFNNYFVVKQIAPTWVWVRYRVGIQSSKLQNIAHCQFYNRRSSLPWTHTNFMAFQQTVSENIYDVWVRIPAQHRFQRNYLKADR